VTSGQRAYRELPHTADTAIEVDGESIAGLFANAAFAMFDLMVDLDALSPVLERVVAVSADSVDEVLVALLSELIALSEIEGFVPCRFKASHASETGVELTMGVAPAAHAALRGPPVKAVTYHELLVEELSSGWRAHLVFDV